MRRFLTLAALVSSLAIFGICVNGCVGLSQEQQDRLEKLKTDREALEKELAGLIEKVKSGGGIDPIEVTAAMLKVQEQLKATITEIETLSSEGGVWAAITGGIALFGRSLLHLAGKIPVGGAAGSALQALLGLLLGGSSTEKKASAKKA